MEKTNNFPKKAVILAGGKGTRFHPISKEIPKSLLPVKGKPIINYLVDLFYSQGVKDIAILISKDFQEDFEWWKKRYCPGLNVKIVPEKEPLGTFGGLYLLKDWIGNTSFFLTNGDEIKEINLTKMADFHRNSDNPATIALIEVEKPEHYGVVICENGKVKEFLEKPENPPSKYINSGLYLFSPEIFEYHQGLKFQMTEKDLFPQLAKEDKLNGFKFQGKWADCGTFERYSEALENGNKY